MQPAWSPGPATPFGPPEFTQSDANNLRLLSVFHYVYAGLLGFGAMVFAIYVVMGIAMVAAPGSGGKDVQMGGGFLIAFGLIVMAAIGGKAALLLVAGRSLAKHRRHTLCVVAAVLSCLAMPLGTVLGVFTLVVLFKPVVRGEFERVANGEDAQMLR